MNKLYNLARMTTSTTGTGPIILGTVVAGAISFADAGVVDSAVVSYGIREEDKSEVGRGTYFSTGPTLTRDTILNSTNGGAAIVLAGNAEVYITVLAEDFDHTALLNIGTHTHAQIDIHINLDDPDSPPTAGDNASLALTYTGEDITQIDKTIGGTTYTTNLVYTYDGDGNLTQLQKIISGITYTKTLTWIAKQLMAVSEWS
jgi:hypothetical protein